jgi:hypothetical protein
MKSQPQISLRELLIVVVFAAFAFAALRTGGILHSVAVMFAIVVTMALAIVAFVGRNTTQAFAIGFLIPVIAYAVTVLVLGKSELDPYSGKLPTSKLLLPLNRMMAKQNWINLSTGQVVLDYDPKNDPNYPTSGAYYGASPMGISETPDRATFMSTGHILFALMFGYAGAKFAVWVYHRRPKVGPLSDKPADG